MSKQKKMEFLAENIKCKGCVKNILEGFSKVEGVSNIEVEISSGKVTFDYEGAEDRRFFIKLLDNLGYPEKGKRNRFKIFGR